MSEKRIALITGANKGIGFEAARQLGREGMTVIVAARAAERGEPAAALLVDEGIDARFVQLDVTDEASVRAAAKWVEAEYGRLDVLVNNAGIAPAEASVSPSELPLKALRATYETNVFGVVAVTNAMLPLLRRAEAARIVNVSSELGSLTLLSDPESIYYPFNLMAYNSSKSALNGITLSYAKELAGTGIKVNAANPGYTATDINGHSGPQTVEEGAACVVPLALLDADGPSGGFFTGTEPLPW
ncbi:SDR family oxidoreductase [Actinomadura rupiterrae]|uniref:SDR family oxidoreductase n=1 Tax=Actinomadura rupiterrae TaxID=559627 RepID=UPI0020A50A13|nr:SDR family oxidoreductase [Actinomadura rupiterrae]MCP2343837.1 NAD(P)-dependent dehydrogenase (short-subunit alcohol dehydrogenase family) [Actinomadura rupiterrae]